jgi:ubiquinone/menaquinone biosynthesis C-methylase UbiE
MFYAGLGVKKIYGVEVLEKYRREAEDLAAELGKADKFEFVYADGADMPFENNSIDTIIMNDAMEHVDDPPAVLAECLRVLAPAGRLYINFPPYYHPFGAHLSDALGMPWVHMFFSDKVLIRAYKDLAGNFPDGDERIAFRISMDENGREYFSYINKMKVRRFKKILKDAKIAPIYYHEAPLRGFLKPLAKIPAVKEMFVKMVVCIIEK